MASAMNLWSNKRKTGRLLAIARPASKKLAFIMKERLRSWRHRKVQLSVSSHCLVQCLTQYCGMSLREVLCGHSALLCSEPVTGGHLKCISVDQWALTLFLACVCVLPRCGGTVLHQTVMILGFVIFLFFCVVLALSLFTCSQLFT